MNYSSVTFTQHPSNLDSGVFQNPDGMATVTYSRGKHSVLKTLSSCCFTVEMKINC